MQAEKLRKYEIHLIELCKIPLYRMIKDFINLLPMSFNCQSKTGKLYRPLVISITLLFFLITAFAGISSSFYKSDRDITKRMEINLRNENSSSDKYILIKDIESVRKNLYKCYISCLRELDSFVQTNNGTYPVKVCLTDNAFPLFSDISMVKGCFFNEAASETGLNSAVISRTLAEKLYGTNGITGNKMELFNEKYKITGLYRDNKSLLSFLSSDGADRIYIPYKSYEKFKDLAVKTVFFRYQGLEAMGFREAYTRNLFKADDRLYKINDYYNKTDLITQLMSLFIFILGIWVILTVVRRTVEYYTSCCRQMKECLQKMYLKEMLINEKVLLLKSFFAFFCSVTFIIIIFIIIRFKVIIPAQYIPYDNVFDFNFYLERLKMHINNANLSAGYIPTNLETCRNYASKISSIFFVLCMVSFLFTVSYLRVLNFINFLRNGFVVVLVLPMISTLLLSFVFSFFLGVRFCFPLKEIGVIQIFLIMKMNFSIESYVFLGLKTNQTI